MTLRIALVGYGKMGKAVENEATARGHQITHRIDAANANEISSLSPENVDVVIEFTNPEVAPGNFKKLLEQGVPVVTGSTGWNQMEAQIRESVNANEGAFLFSSNFSPGVNMLFKMNQQLAKLMNRYPEYDVFVTEKHHKFKKDSPSGTANTLGMQLIEELDRKTALAHDQLTNRPPEEEEISVAYTRAGGIIGEHSVTYLSDIDELSISHRALNRRGFALGAVLAAEWLKGRKGFFNFLDIFE